MGVDYFPCVVCGEFILDSCDYFDCNLTCHRWCVSRKKGFYPYDSKEDATDDVLLQYLLNKVGLTREEAVGQWAESMKKKGGSPNANP